MASSSIRQGADSNKKVQVNSENVKYTDDYVFSQYPYESVKVVREGEKLVAEPTKRMYEFRTGWKVPKLGVMIVGLGGNNGSTLVAGVIANREGICWRTKTGVQRPNYFGSITQASTVRLGVDEAGNDVWIPLCNMVPMVDPNNIEFGGWDINSSNLAEAMERAQVLEYDLQRQLAPHMVNMKPLPSIYSPDYIAMNQADRANNVLTGSKVEMLEKIRADIRNFKKERGVDKVVVIWSANTERYSDVIAGLNDTEDNLMASIRSNEDEISPSTLFAVACIQEHTTYINGSPQNTFVPGVIEMACREGVMIGGDDFKTGQTKMKSVMVDWLISAGIKPVSIVSYNHLGNNDGKNLSAPQQFRSKEISKSNVVDDMVASNPVLYEPHEHPDHCVVIKYVPYVGDSKRAMDEYTSQIFMGGHNTIVMHNTCEDSLLAAPIIMDLVILAELLERIEWKTGDMAEYEHFHPIMSLLSYLIKAPLVPPGTPVVNALFKQRAAIENVLRALIGLPVEGFTSLEHRAIPRSKQLEAFSFGQGC